MARDFKFRAWENGKMVQWPEWAITFHGQLLKEYAPDFEYLTGTAMPPVMQYTGLKDKNGVEIYEGDIVAVSNVTGDRLSDVVQATGQVKWSDDSADYDIVNAKGGFLLSFGMKGNVYEVIGNIYENPELLKEAA